ncbi:hypothetical protein [Sodaliphilus sp.]|uniref:hypothetical protein n=1 Tax=Sodaliphilus sp. TaxID=2815818 RepID=UPI00389052AE
MKIHLLVYAGMALALCSCIGKTGTQENTGVAAVNDSVATNNVAAGNGEDDGESYWLPEQFKKEHPQEWDVVNMCMQEQQKEGDVDFSVIDKHVSKYLTDTGIKLSKDRVKAIEQVEKVCNEKFDFSKYQSDDNMSMLVSSGTKSLFADYVTWLYEQEARRMFAKNKSINIDKELKMYRALSKALYDMCDQVVLCTEGSGGWVVSEQLGEEDKAFERGLFTAILGGKFEERPGIDAALGIFDRELKDVVEDYNQINESRSKNNASIANKYRTAFHQWVSYRRSIPVKLADKALKQKYMSLTHSVIRTHLIHLKNHYNDLGLTSPSLADICLNDDCTNDELLQFDWNEKYQNTYCKE